MADRDADLGHPVHHTEVPYAELTTWLARHAHLSRPTVLLTNCSSAYACWADPHWPGYRY
jgi:hypothetical protein